MKRGISITLALLVVVGLAGVAAAASTPAISNVRASSIGTSTATLNADVNPNGAATTYRFQWGTTTAYGFSSAVGSAGAGTKPVAERAKISGLDSGTTYHYRVIANSALGQAVSPDATFTTGGSAPSSPRVQSLRASGIAPTSAVLKADVNPDGDSTTYEFEWGTTTAYGSVSIAGSAGTGTKFVAVQSTATGLTPGTAYHFRVIAFNKYGQTASPDATFRTTGPPPAGVATGPAKSVTKTTAVLTGGVAPNGAATSWTFQYGTTTAYGSYTSGGSVPATTPEFVTSPLNGLAPGTVFHYRLIARHGNTVLSYGADQSFMTLPTRRPVPGIRARTAPYTDSSRPYVFTTSGRLLAPRSTPAQFGCTGRVAIRYYRGTRQVAFILVSVAPDCSFRGQVRFAHLVGPRRLRHGHQRLAVRIFFRGNGYLYHRAARTEHVVLG